MKKRIISLFLIFSLSLCLFPSIAWASDKTPNITENKFVNSVMSSTVTPSGYTPISSAEEFNNIRNNTSGNYILLNDINLSEYDNWTPISSFSGTLDGNGYVIKNCTISALNQTTTAQKGIFNTVTGTIKNLGIVNASVKVTSTSAVIFGGGLAAVNQGTIDNCYFDGTLTVETETASIIAVGTIAAYNKGTLKNNAAYGYVNVTSQATQVEAGGISGESGTEITGCVNESTVYVTSSSNTTFCGGIVGRPNAVVNKCTNIGEVTVSATSADVFAGGICGYVSYEVGKCRNLGIVTASSKGGNAYAGGIVGVFDVDSGAVHASENFNEGDILAQNMGSAASYAGGIAGVLQGYYHIDNSYNNGRIKAESSGTKASAGGIVGNLVQNISYGTVNYTYNTGRVTSSNTSQFGGICGSYSYSYVMISDTIKNSLSIHTNGLYGTSINNAIIADSCANYYLIPNMLELQSTYSGWDFSDIWEFGDGSSYKYPTLKNVPRVIEYTENISEDSYINAHINFINNRYSAFVSANSFNDGYWQYDNGDSLLAFQIWDVVGDIGEVLTLQFNDLTINANFYELFLSEFIVMMNDVDLNESLSVKVVDKYEEVYSTLVDNTVNTIIDEIDNSTDYKKQLDGKFNGWDTYIKGDFLNQEIKGILSDPDYEPHALTQCILSDLLGDVYFDNEAFITNIFSKFNSASDICGYISDATDVINAFRDAEKAYIAAQAFCEVNADFYDIFNNIADIMKQSNASYALEFEAALNKYYELANNPEKLTKLYLTELGTELLWKAYDMIEQGYLEKLVYQKVGEFLGIKPLALQILIQTYNGAYKLLDNITKISDKSEEYYTMNYVAPLEQALDIVVGECGDKLQKNPTMDNAANYDYAFICLKEVNKYLYESLYDYSALFQSHISSKTTEASHDLMQLATYYKNAWNNVNCHAGTSTTKYKYTSIQCPVDVYVYNYNDELVLAIVNEKVVEYQNYSITVMNCNGKKTVMYPADENYRIEIVSREAGTMNYYVSETDNVTSTRNIDFYDIALEEDKIFRGAIPDDFGIDKSVYSLTDDTGEISSDYDSNEMCLDTLVELKWTEKTASWKSVENAIGYSVNLYCDSQLISNVFTDNTFFDFSDMMEQPGKYQYDVVAVGDGINYDNSRRSTKSQENIVLHKITITGEITSYGDINDAVTVTLYDTNGTKVDTVMTTDGTYTVSATDGDYTLEVSKLNHVTREYEVTVDGDEVTQDVKICLLGDVDLNGKVNTRDWNALRDHLNKSSLITDTYALKCADTYPSNTINTRDWNALRDHLNKSKPLW